LADSLSARIVEARVCGLRCLSFPAAKQCSDRKCRDYPECTCAKDHRQVDDEGIVKGKAGLERDFEECKDDLLVHTIDLRASGFSRGMKNAPHPVQLFRS
jgi:hypothetical protein